MEAVKHRRNHVLTALGLLVAAGLIALGAYQPVISVRGPEWSLELTKGLGIGLDPSASGGLDETSQALLVSFAAATAIMGLLLLVTRVRYLGLFWRMLALAFLAVPAVLSFYWWRFVSDPVAALQPADPTVADKLLGSAESLVTGLGLVRVTAGQGLYLLAGGTLLGILSCLVPALRSIKRTEVGLGYASSASPGWYVSRDDPRFVDYWDGRAWRARQERGLQEPDSHG